MARQTKITGVLACGCLLTLSVPALVWADNAGAEPLSSIVTSPAETPTATHSNFQTFQPEQKQELEHQETPQQIASTQPVEPIHGAQSTQEAQSSQGAEPPQAEPSQSEAPQLIEPEQEAEPDQPAEPQQTAQSSPESSSDPSQTPLPSQPAEPEQTIAPSPQPDTSEQPETDNDVNAVPPADNDDPNKDSTQAQDFQPPEEDLYPEENRQENQPVPLPSWQEQDSQQQTAPDDAESTPSPERSTSPENRSGSSLNRETNSSNTPGGKNTETSGWVNDYINKGAHQSFANGTSDSTGVTGIGMQEQSSISSNSNGILELGQSLISGRNPFILFTFAAAGVIGYVVRQYRRENSAKKF